MKIDNEVQISKQHTPCKDKKKPNIFFETVTGLLFYVLCAALLAAVYVCIFGYLGGHLLFYAFSVTLAIPITFNTCFTWGLLPVLNILGFIIAAYILMWKFLLYLGWKLLMWLLDILPGFLRRWAENIGR